LHTNKNIGRAQQARQLAERLSQCGLRALISGCCAANLQENLSSFTVGFVGQVVKKQRRAAQLLPTKWQQSTLSIFFCLFNEYSHLFVVVLFCGCVPLLVLVSCLFAFAKHLLIRQSAQAGVPFISVLFTDMSRING